jgi:hypothetical protein
MVVVKVNLQGGVILALLGASLLRGIKLGKKIKSQTI